MNTVPLWIPEGRNWGKGELGSLEWTCAHCYILNG